MSNGAEYEAEAVKAAFLHRFGAYVEWPEPKTDTFTIAVLDDSRIVSHLERLLPGLTIKGRRPRVRSISTPREIGDAQILYIGSSHASRARTLVQSLTGQPILIVTEQKDGLDCGASINFVQVGRNIRFEISLDAARRNRLQISSGLLSVAVRVEEGPRGRLDEFSGGQFAQRQHFIIGRQLIRVFLIATSSATGIRVSQG